MREISNLKSEVSAGVVRDAAVSGACRVLFRGYDLISERRSDPFRLHESDDGSGLCTRDRDGKFVGRTVIERVSGLRGHFCSQNGRIGVAQIMDEAGIRDLCGAVLIRFYLSVFRMAFAVHACVQEFNHGSGLGILYLNDERLSVFDRCRIRFKTWEINLVYKREYP